MPNDSDPFELEMPGSWAKKYFLASRVLMESVLRPFDLGNTQWYVLYRLSAASPLAQRLLTRELDVERATLSAVISALVRKGARRASAGSGRSAPEAPPHHPRGQKAVGNPLPDIGALIGDVAFDGVDPDDIATMNRVLSGAPTTDRLSKGTPIMTILITGATGLVGPRLLARLTAADIACRALVRSG